MFRDYETYLVDIIRGKRRGVVPGAIKGGLRVLSWWYRLGVAARNWAFDQGWYRQYYPPVPVVSIGNIVAGGTGKTPVTLLLAKAFYGDIPIAVLSRGYRSPVERLPAPIMLSDGHGPLHPATFSGDEPYLLAENLPNAVVVVGPDRRKGSVMAVSAGARLIFLDDGMQHRALARDFEVVVLDGHDPFGHGRFLPAGFLREGVAALSRADLIVVNHAPQGGVYETLKGEILKHSRAPIVCTKAEVLHVWDLQDDSEVVLKGKKVGMFCGIAHPEYFRCTLEKLGAEVVAQHITADHAGTDETALLRFANKCVAQGVDALVCTEKDKVKLPKPLSLPLPSLWVQMQLSLTEGQDHWKALVARIKEKVSSR